MLLVALGWRPSAPFWGLAPLAASGFPTSQQGTLKSIRTFEARQTEVPVPVLSLTCCVASGKQLYLSEPHVNKGAWFSLPGKVLARIRVFIWEKLVPIPVKSVFSACHRTVPEAGPRRAPGLPRGDLDAIIPCCALNLLCPWSMGCAVSEFVSAS